MCCMTLCTDSSLIMSRSHNVNKSVRYRLHPPVRTKYQVSVHKPRGHHQTNQLQQSTNNGQLVNAINKARQSPYTNKGCRCNGNDCRLLFSPVPLDLQSRYQMKRYCDETRCVRTQQLLLQGQPVNAYEGHLMIVTFHKKIR